MRLEITDPREALTIRMRAYAYEHVRQGAYKEAQTIAEMALAAYDSMIEHNPTDEPGFWANRCYERFKDECDAI